MPLSEQSRRALEGAIRLNPAGALQLASILVTAPRAVKYKPKDRIGPLGILVRPGGPAAEASATFTGLVRPFLPGTLKEDAEAFQREWIMRRFSKAELAHEIKLCLEGMGVDCQALDDSAAAAAWRVMASTGGRDGGALDAFFPPG